MDEETQTLIGSFFDKVNADINAGMRCRDAIDMAAVTVGGFMPAIVSRAASKYQEASHPEMPLSQQENVDTLAFASMGRLWHNEKHEEMGEATVEDLLAQSIYLILKYAQEKEPQAHLDAALKANAKAAGDKEAREAAIYAMLG